MSADLKHFYRRSPDSDFNNVSSLSDVIVKGPHNIRGDDKFKDEIQLVAGFKAQYEQVITDHSGPQTRFIYLSINGGSEPWVIISIGTGS